mmetsp:Transcript_11336/g.32653  ORF Transcript_11336/g.32653 Transcript_11336/m.32653 type:complete len:242 (-) Transcript_11336:203-928(-)
MAVAVAAMMMAMTMARGSLRTGTRSATGRETRAGFPLRIHPWPWPSRDKPGSASWRSGGVPGSSDSWSPAPLRTGRTPWWRPGPMRRRRRQLRRAGPRQRNARQGRRFDLVGLDWIGLDSNPHGLNQLVALASRCSWIVSGVESTNGLGLELGWLARSLARSVSFFGKEPVSIDMIEPDSVCPTSVRRIESNRGEAKRDDSVVPPCRGEECGSDQMEERTSADYYYGSRLLHRYCVANTTP